MTLAEFIMTHALTLTFTPVPENPYMRDDTPSRDPGRMHFHCVITNGSRSFTTYYTVGSGIVDAWLRGHGPKGSRLTDGGNLNDFVLYPRTVDGQAYRARHAPKFRPELADILDCVASDSSGVDQARNFGEWCGDYGYDVDSRKAFQTYETCLDQAKELRELLGRGAYETLLYTVERL